VTPLVTVIVPCYNEEATIALLLDAVYRQTWPINEIEVLIADGISTDNTRERIIEFKNRCPELEVHIIENPLRIIPAALNCALRAAQGEYIVRLDAHSMPAPNYIERCLENLKNNMGDTVGGIWQIEPGAETWMAQAIAIAAAHPLGVGDARYRYSHRPGEVDTVPFGAFRRDLIEKIGYFDEELLTNEDYEFNARILRGGGRVWFDPDIRSVYFARPDLNALARQYWRYGYWKFRMLRRYPGSLRWRQALPPLFVLGVSLLAVFGIFQETIWWLLLAGLLFYFLILLAASLPLAVRKRDIRLVVSIPLAISVMHFSWGSGFLWSMVYLWFGGRNH